MPRVSNRSVSTCEEIPVSVEVKIDAEEQVWNTLGVGLGKITELVQAMNVGECCGQSSVISQTLLVGWDAMCVPIHVPSDCQSNAGGRQKQR